MTVLTPTEDRLYIIKENMPFSRNKTTKIDFPKYTVSLTTNSKTK